MATKRGRKGPPLPPEPPPADSSLAALKLFGADGGEEVLLPAPVHGEVAETTTLRVALPPGAKCVTLRAVARSRHALVAILRWMPNEPTRACELLHLTMRRDAPMPSREQHDAALQLQKCARGFFVRSRVREVRRNKTGEVRFRQLPSSSAHHPAVARARTAEERWRRAEGIHCGIAPAPAGGRGSKKAAAPPPSPIERALTMLEHRWSIDAWTLSDPMDGVSAPLKAFLRSNILALVARLRQVEADGMVEQNDFEAALVDLGVAHAVAGRAELDALYSAMGVTAARREARIRCDELKHFLLPTSMEVGRDCTRRITLWGAADREEVATSAGVAKVGNGKGKVNKGGASPKKGGSNPPKERTAAAPGAAGAASKEAAEVALLEAALPKERSATVRIIVIGEDHTYSTYHVHVTIAPPDWPVIPSPPPEVQPILSDILRYYGDKIPKAVVPAPLPSGRIPTLAQRQAAAVASGTAMAEGEAVEIERFVACCGTLGIASAAVSRLTFRQVSRERPYALLGAAMLWRAIFLAFARTLSCTPLAPRVPHRMYFDPEYVLPVAMSTLLPLQYGLWSASALGRAMSTGRHPPAAFTDPNSIEQATATTGSESWHHVEVAVDDEAAKVVSVADDESEEEEEVNDGARWRSPSPPLLSTPARGSSSTSDLPGATDRLHSMQSLLAADASATKDATDEGLLYKRTEPLHLAIPLTEKAIPRVSHSAAGMARRSPPPPPKPRIALTSTAPDYMRHRVRPTAMYRGRRIVPNSPNPALAPATVLGSTREKAPTTDASAIAAAPASAPRYRPAPAAPPGVRVFPGSEVAHTLLEREERWAQKTFVSAVAVAATPKRAPPQLPPRVPDLVGAADAEEPRQYLAHCHAGLWAMHSRSAEILLKPPPGGSAAAARDQESPTIAVHFLRTATLPHAVRNAAKPLLVLLPAAAAADRAGGGKKGKKGGGKKSKSPRRKK